MTDSKNRPSKPFLRNNENLKTANFTEHISKEEFEFRVSEIAKCKADPIYFGQNYYTIVSIDKGRHVIQMYEKQKQFLTMLRNEKRVICTASRQVGKTTTYSIYSLWHTLFNNDKKVLICAQTGTNAVEFLSNIRMAYEDIPNWLKPGCIEYNKKRIAFGNGSQIQSTMTSPSVRGSTGGTLILDEFAIIDNNVVEEFWSAVYPTVSSSKNSKVIIVSTPKGVGNMYHRIYTEALKGSPDGWKPFIINWFDVPGRDEEWKKQTIASMCHGNMIQWNQEFACQFIGSSYTLVPPERLEKFPNTITEPIASIKYNTGECLIWEQPKRDGIYIVGADVSEGVGGDSSVCVVLNVTNPLEIIVTATYKSDMVSPVEFAGILNNLCKKYTNATLALECNSIGKSTLDTLWNTYEYDNIVNIRKAGSSSRGIFSNFSVKLDACIWFRDYLNMPECNIKLNDKSLLSELEVFERVGDSDKPIFRAASNMHDDYCMALIWGMFILNEKHVEKYFEVIDWHMATTNVKVPKKIVSYYSAYFDPNAMESITNSIVKKEITGQMDYATSNSPKSPSDEGTTIGFASF